MHEVHSTLVQHILLEEDHGGRKKVKISIIAEGVTLEAITFFFVGDAQLILVTPLHPLRLLVNRKIVASSQACIDTF